ncbi:neutral/alkaline non-lysosomal ceramidase N-terminal domain-containing protein [Sinimarinibacterium flocculans]|uniref:neutral/alkaline non-lysosomal ceramidase N-terminal domain-containing protein n=1 Tax=Sinimarinibacterium flocculans TaxID=985250 RepID=UPI00249132FC|nr:neutral/alkaline non-lysosomal ceramidase N-terminal domain-containing protein [Sinimarinibacterium flocculans]
MPHPSRIVTGTLLASAIVTLCACGDSTAPAAGLGSARGVADTARAQCTLNSPYLQVGAQIDAPGRRLAVEPAAVGEASGDCAGNTAFRFGSGLHDITGPVANTSGMGWEDPTQVFHGLYTRQYARAFALASPCNGKRVVFVSTDTGQMFGAVRLGVLEQLAADPALAPHYGPDNLMLSATHTHQGPAGYSHYEAFNFLHLGFDQLVLDTIVDGIVEAIRLAHANLEAHPQTAPVELAIGELLNTNINRSRIAFEQNPEAERLEFTNARGEIVDTNKRFVQLNLARADGNGVGVINWFGVHPTILGPELDLVGSDHKGEASLGFERIMHTDYAAQPGTDNFVAAFAQTDEGDSSPNLFIVERPHPDPTRGGGADPYESTSIAAAKQLAKSLELYTGGGRALRGPVDYRLMHVQMDAVEVTDPVVLASLQHPATLDTEVKRTCLGVLGPSFAAGAEDGPGFTVEGIDCGDDPALLDAVRNDLVNLLGAHLPAETLSQAVFCNIDELPLLDLSCQAEKPVLIPVGPPLSFEPNIVPFQLFRVGNFAILGVPWEVTTMSARRLQKTLFEVLAPVGIDTIVIAGLVNEFAHYLTTREEYATQQYEGSSNLYGPWTLAAVQQESRRLALSLAAGAPAPDGPDYVDSIPLQRRTPYVPSDLPGLTAGFGDVIGDVPQTAAPGDVVRFEIQGGHPRNDLKTQSSYVYAERLVGDERWEVVAQDRDPELRFVWKPLIPSPLPIDTAQIGPSTVEAVWTIPRNLAPGTYRLRIEGVAQTLVLPAQAYDRASSPFLVTGPAEACHI